MIESVKSGRSSRMRTDDLESAFAIRRASVTDSSAVSVEWPLLKPDCLASSLLFCERNNETWLKTTRLKIYFNILSNLIYSCEEKLNFLHHYSSLHCHMILQK